MRFVEVGMLSIVVLITYQRSRSVAEIGFRKSLLTVHTHSDLVVAQRRGGGGGGGGGGEEM